MTRWTVLLLGLALLAACADRKEAAKDILISQLPEKRHVEFRNLQEHPDGAICGEYRIPDPSLGSTRYHAFVVWADQVVVRPSKADLEIYCSEDAQAALLAIYGIGPASDPANRVQQVRDDIHRIEAALQAYLQDMKSTPTTRQGLGALLTPPEQSLVKARFREGGYLPQLPQDPWGHPYHYERSGLGGVASDYRVYTLGADGAVGGSGKDADIGSEHLMYLDFVAP